MTDERRRTDVPTERPAGPALAGLEHLHGDRGALMAPGGPAERARPDAIVDTFAGAAGAEKARALSTLAERVGAGQLVVTSSIDVYRHCNDAGVDGSPPALWSATGPLGSWYSDEGGPLALWREVAPAVTNRPVAGGHFFPEENPRDTARALADFFAADGD